MKPTIFITGIASGIGLKTAEIAISRNYTVTGIDKRGAPDILTDRERISFYQGDVSDIQFIQHTLADIVQKFGKIDQCFNNAGILGNRSRLDDFDAGNWNSIINVNLTGTLICLSTELNFLQRTGGGSIVNNASISGVYASKDYPYYCAAKHGIIGLTKSAAKQYVASKIRCNAICPSTVSSPMTQKELEAHTEDENVEALRNPAGRFATETEIANSVLWLLSDEASYMTGECMIIDGGLML